MTEVLTHAVREFHRNRDEIDLFVEEIRNVGYTVVESNLSNRELAMIREKVDDIYELQLQEIGGEQVLKRINDSDLVRCIIGYDEYFLTLATQSTITAVTGKLLGQSFVLMSQNAIINRPMDSHYQFSWHRDLNYQHYVSSRPLAVSALYAIDEFTPETGGTWLLPASHKVEPFPSPEYLRRHAIQITAPAGSILLFDAMLWHRAGTNRSDKVRRSVNNIYSVPMIQQQISLPLVLKGKFSDDPFLRMFLGYETSTGVSVTQWRTRKLEQLERTERTQTTN